MFDPDSIKQLIDQMLAFLPPRQQTIIKMRFGLWDGERKTLQQIGDHFGVTRERIRQLEKKAMRKLKHPSRIKLFNQFLALDNLTPS
jgi:RNA polymerase primary sigma factor